METYQQAYYVLFHAITETIEQLKAQNYGTALTFLIAAQQNTEEIFISKTDTL